MARGLWYFVGMTDGQLVKLDSGAVAQVKRLAVTGAPYATVLIAVTIAVGPPSDTTKH